jgi:hypothetical protein
VYTFEFSDRREMLQYFPLELGEARHAGAGVARLLVRAQALG